MKNHATVIPLWRRGVLLVAVALCVAPGALASDEGDFEYWAKANFLIPIDETWEFRFSEKLTFGDDGGRLDDHQVDFCFNYSGLADWLSLGLGYKQQFEKEGDGWQVENRPLLNIVVKGKPFGLTMIDRSRFEYRDIEDEETVWRYRNKVLLTLGSLRKTKKILPYVADEIFVSFDEEDFNQQRLYGGFFIPLHEKLRLELFYFWNLDEQEDNSWHDTNVLGSYLYFLF